MADRIINRAGKHEQALKELLLAIHHVKIMIWAGDYIAARDEIEQVVRQHKTVIERAVKLKKDLSTRRKELKPLIEERIQQQVIKSSDRSRTLRKQQKAEVQRVLSLEVRPKTEEEISLFVIAPVANMAMRLHRMFFDHIATEEELRKPQQMGLPYVAIKEESFVECHDDSGFLLAKRHRSEGLLEIRAYQLGPLTLKLSVFLERLEATLNVTIDVIEGATSPVRWPFLVRAFTSFAFIEITIFEPGRILINLTTRSKPDDRQLEEDRLIEIILDSIAAAQSKDRAKV